MLIAKMVVFGLALTGAGCATQVFTLTEYDGRLYGVVHENVLECRRTDTVPTGDGWRNLSLMPEKQSGAALVCEYIPVMVKSSMAWPKSKGAVHESWP
jgi:hypothetical protein